MASKPLSKGQQNFTQLAIACVEVINQVFNDCLDSQISPKDLYNAIKSCSKLTNGKDKLNQYQLKICCISPPQVPDYGKFDVSLFYKLMRNLCLTFKPTTGWGNTPKTSDLQIGDDIERLRIFRNNMFAHLESSEVPDGIFSQCWKELKGCVRRAQSFLDSLGYGANYDEQLKDIENLDLSCKDMDKYRLFLEETMFMWRLSQNIDVPAITMTGYCDVFCGEETCFEAKTDNCPKSNKWPIVWERVRGSVTETIDKSAKKYEGSTSRRLVIRRVVKEDEGEYRAVISRELNGSHINVPSNTLFLNALGDHPNLEINQATSGIDGVTILYDIEETRPVIKKIMWTKDGEPLSMDAIKYQGGGVSDRYLKILSPSENDSGEYTCRVFNAVGSDMKRIVLAIPSVVICKELTVPLGGQATIIPDITSCPSPEKALWLKSQTQAPENFLTIDMDDARYFGSSMDPEKPILVISNASYIDNLHYRLEVTNGFGKSTSNAVLLKVVGDIPSVFATLETNIADRSVTFVCKFSLSDNNPKVTEIIWIKDKQYIDISASGGKYAGGSIADPSLVVHRVNWNDSGEYQCRVSNAAGSMLSSPINLGKPRVYIGSLEKDAKTDTLVCKATIESIPEAIKAEWRVQQTPDDDFQLIDVHDSSYRGSTDSLPHPVLIVHEYSNKQGQQFRISVSSFTGETTEVILGRFDKKRKIEDCVQKGHEKRMKFYQKGGSKIPFANLKDDLDNSFPQGKLERLKYLLIDQEEMDEDDVSACNSFRDVLKILIQKDLFCRKDVILVQYLFRKIGCFDLYEICYNYAKDCEALCFFESPPENGYKNVKFHIHGNIEEYSKEDILFIQKTVAKMMNCSKEYVIISGLEHDKSFLVILSIKEEYTKVFLTNAQQILQHLCSLKVDYLVYGETVIWNENISQERHNMETEKLEDEDKFYQETHSFNIVMENLRSQNCVTFVGVPGSGKSAMARHIALRLQKEGYKIVTITDIRQMDYYCYQQIPHVFVFDDAVGVFGLHRAKLNLLAGYEHVIRNPLRPDLKTLFTCRESVFNETLSYKSFFTRNECVFRMHSFKNALNVTDKKLILEKYHLDSESLSASLLQSTIRMFPLLCKLFSKEAKFKIYGSEFFTSPLKCFIATFDEMQEYNKLQYAALVLCMFNEKLSEDILKDKKNSSFLAMKNSVLKSLNMETFPSAFMLVNALTVMEETFIRKSGTKFTFVHDYLYEVCAYHYGQQFPAQILQYMSSSYIANRVKPRKRDVLELEITKTETVSESDEDYERNNERDYNNSDTEESFDLCIRLSEDLYPMLAKRLYRDIQRMKLHDVFTNSVLRHPQLCQAFIDVLEEKSYGEIKSLFLYEQMYLKTSDKETSQDRFSLMADTQFHETDKVKVIRWIVYYGHHKILQYIVDEIEKHHETKSELFSRTASDQDYPCIRSKKIRKHEDTSSYEEKLLVLFGCYSGDLKTVKILLKNVSKDSIKSPILKENRGKLSETLNSKSYFDLRICTGCTPLVAACKSGHLRIVQELIKAGANVNLQGEKENTPLMTAIKGHSLSIMQELIKAGADVNLSDVEGNTPLVTAVESGYFTIVQKLLEEGANVNLLNRIGNTPLVAACMGGHLSIVKELLKTGADTRLQGVRKNLPTVSKSDVNLGGRYKPFMSATEGEQLKTEQYMKRYTPLGPVLADNSLYGVRRNLPSETMSGIFPWNFQLMTATEGEQLKRITPLVAACIGGHLCIVQELIKAGADVNLWDEEGKTPLITAVEGDHLNIVQKLIDVGADVNLRNVMENTPLVAACMNGHIKIVQELVKMGADISLQGSEGNTPLASACKCGHLSIARELVKAGANINQRDTQKFITPLKSETESKNFSTEKNILERRLMLSLHNRMGNTPLLSLHNRMGNTPLVAACIGGHLGIVQELLKLGADVNLKDVRRTPLTAACQGGHLNIVQELIKAGADVNLMDNTGETPKKVAHFGQHYKILNILGLIVKNPI